MKKTTLYFLLTMLLFCVSNAWADASWVKTAPEDLQSGDVVAFVELTNSYVLTNNSGTGSAPAAATISLNDDKSEILGQVSDQWKWEVTVSDNGLQLNVPGSSDYLYCTNTNNGVRVGSNTNNVFTISEEGYLFNKATSRYIGVYKDKPDWRCYTSINNNIKDQSFAFFKYTDGGGGGTTVAKPTFNPAGGIYTEALTVTISADEDCYILYTTDGISPKESQAAILVEGNTATVEVKETTTIRAFALDRDENKSSEAVATYKIVTPVNTIAELCAAATETLEPAVVVFNNWICTGVASSNAYFTDGKNGILLYQNGHGFEVGDVLTGSTQVSLTLYNECAEIVGLTSTSQGLTVTKGEGAIPMKVVISDLEKNMQGNLITLENVTYNAASGVFIDDDDNEITPYNRFIKLPTLIDGKPYNVTGVAIWFANKQVWEIAPRTEQEFQLLTSQIAPVSSWSVASESVYVNGTPTATFTTNSDGAVTYTSSDENVATIDANGNITPKAYGVTTITANVAETETYLADSKSFTLRVNEEGYAEVVFAYNDEDIAGLGAPDTGAEITVTRNDVITFYANKAYAKPDDTHIKIYGSKFEKQGEGEEETTVLTEPSIIQLSVVNGYAIVKVTLTATGEGYIKEWKDQYGTAAAIDGATATWEGDCEKVVLTNQASSQARIKTIAVTYIDTSIVDAISLTPATSEGEKVIYNLAGQRLQKMQKGINIVGGKKYIVK